MSIIQNNINMNVEKANTNEISWKNCLVQQLNRLNIPKKSLVENEKANVLWKQKLWTEYFEELVYERIGKDENEIE